jgi:serine phosphatase RsbU (regulator of sigma subunit)
MTPIETQAMQETVSSLVDVLFVTNQPSIPQPIRAFLKRQNYTWAKVQVEQFCPFMADFKVVGTVILDTTEIESAFRDRILQTLKGLEQSNIATILLNDQIEFPYSEFKLATILQSATPAEIEGRIETNIAYNRSLSERRLGGPKVGDEAELAEDTVEQLRMAGEVQRYFLPQELPNSDLLRWAVVYEPAEWVSGDLYDVRRLDEQHIGFYIADAVGHSMPAALLTMFLKQAIVMRETHGNQYRIHQPLEVICEANQKMAEQHLNGCLFATCCYGLLNVRTMQLSFTRAGHPYPVLIRPGQPPRQLESRGGLLGVFEEADFEQKSLQLTPHDKVFLYSDGCESLLGQCDDSRRFVFSDEFLDIAPLPAGEMMFAFGELARKRQMPRCERDDITAIVMEVM